MKEKRRLNFPLAFVVDIIRKYRVNCVSLWPSEVQYVIWIFLWPLASYGNSFTRNGMIFTQKIKIIIIYTLLSIAYKLTLSIGNSYSEHYTMLPKMAKTTFYTPHINAKASSNVSTTQRKIAH